MTASAFAADDATGRRLTQSFISTKAVASDISSGAAVVFRRKFTLDALPKMADLHLFADARYVLWINGKYVTRGPARFEPMGPEYDTIDVSRHLQAGQNAISILVTGRISNGQIRWRPIGLTAELVTDGAVTLKTDSQWRFSTNTRYRSVSVNWANVYDSADARVEDGDWTQAEYNDSKWSAANPVASGPAPLRVRTVVNDGPKELVITPIAASWWGPLSARRTPMLRETVVLPKWEQNLPVDLRAGEEVKFKFSRLVLAFTTLELDAEAGSEIELTYSPGTKYVCRAGPQTFVTSDTHSIFEGAIRVKVGQVTLKKVEFTERLYPFDRVGSFRSSDPLLDKLWTTCVRGLEVTSEDAYVDCTDRERVEWMDCDPPVFDVTRVAMAGADARLLESMLRRTAFTLQPEGWVKAHTASDRFDIHAKMEDRGCDFVQGARRYYESTGKTAVLKEIWPAIAAQMDYFLAQRTARGLVVGREWVVWGNPVGYQTCEGTALNCFVYRALADAAFIGRVIGQDGSRFDRAANDLRAAINRELWDEKSGSYFGGIYDLETAKRVADYRPLKLSVKDGLIEPTRHAALFALDQGVVPEDRKAATSRFLFAHPPTENDIMQYYYYFKQQYLADSPEMDLSVLQTLRREWKDMAESPYEATFEGLHSWGSQAHCYGMFPAYFLSAYVLGVRVEGDHRLLIEPRLGDLTEASGTVGTEFGVVPVSWKRTAAGGSFEVTVPVGCTVRLRVPGRLVSSKRAGRWSEVELGPGSHSGTWSN